MFILKRSFGVSGGLYQSVMIVPPKGSAEASGMNDTVSSEACQRKLFTAMPLPLPPPASGLLGEKMVSRRLVGAPPFGRSR